ncbi:acetyltransferase [Frateuria sp. Soil773]|nr:acetyltransferase [Frateuria sp. Soil773]
MAGRFAALVPVLETDRLRLRAHREADHGDCYATWSHPDVTRFIGGKPQTAEQAWDRMLRSLGLWAMLGYGYWAVEEKSGGRYVGDVGHADLRRDIDPSLRGMAEFGWVLSPWAHGKGYATEAVAAATAWAREHIPQLRAVCIIAPENAPSIRVAEKAGFSKWADTVYHDAPIGVYRR